MSLVASPSTVTSSTACGSSAKALLASPSLSQKSAPSYPKQLYLAFYLPTSERSKADADGRLRRSQTGDDATMTTTTWTAATGDGDGRTGRRTTVCKCMRSGLAKSDIRVKGWIDGASPAHLVPAPRRVCWSPDTWRSGPATPHHRQLSDAFSHPHTHNGEAAGARIAFGPHLGLGADRSAVGENQDGDGPSGDTTAAPPTWAVGGLCTRSGLVRSSISTSY